MSFEKFGVVSHSTETKIAEFIDYLEQGKVMYTMCEKCGAVYFPPKRDCPKCLGEEIRWREIKEEGKLLSYTVVHYGPAGFEDKIPYILGLAEFTEGVKVLALFNREIPLEKIRIGMKIKVVPVKFPPDRISYEFQLNRRKDGL